MTKSTASPRAPRLVLRFALYSALALLLAGVGILWFVRHETQMRAEDDNVARGERVAQRLDEMMRASDFKGPVSSQRLAALDKSARTELSHSLLLIKVWNRAGIAVYSSNHAVIGQHSQEMDVLRRTFAGHTGHETSHLSEEGVSGPDRKVLEAYTPVRLPGQAQPIGALEVSFDYAPVESDVRQTVTPIAGALLVALLALWGTLLPILGQVTKALEHRNRRLEQQADELERTLNERRQAVASLRDAETRYRTLVEQLPLVTYVSAIDKPGFSAYVSPQIETMLGYTAEEWLETPNLFWRALHPDDLERVRTEHRQGYDSGGAFSSQYRLVARDGRVVWVEDQVQVVHDAEGTPVQAQGFLLDITDRKTAELALGENEERFRTLVANVPGVIFRCAIDDDWTMEYLSDEVEELVGYPPSDFVGNSVRTFVSVIHPEDAPVLAKEVANAVAEARPYTIEYRVVHRNGDLRYVVERGQAILGADGERKLDGAIFDLTARRLAEEERLTLASIVESTDDAVMSVDLDGNILSWNHGAENVFGFSAEEALGQPISIMAPPDRENEPFVFLEELTRDKTVAHHDTVRRRKDGTLIDVSLTLSPLTDAGGKFIGASAIARDTTQRKQAELERERLVHELAAQNESLLELDRLKDEFVALVSHELRTPLTSIRGYLELLLEGEAGDLNDEQRQFLGVVERNAHRLLALVGDLLFLAQVEAGKLSLEIGAVDIGAVAAESVETTRPLAEEKGVTLTLATGPLPLLAGDRARLAQLLDNLISNGIKFTPSGGRIDVRVRGERGNAILEVRDTGMGIAPEEQEQLFQRFFRTSKATEQAIPGTGLGLAISKAIVQAHGGRITVASDESAGSTFRVSLPIRQAQREPTEAEQVAL